MASMLIDGDGVRFDAKWAMQLRRERGGDAVLDGEAGDGGAASFAGSWRAVTAAKAIRGSSNRNLGQGEGIETGCHGGCIGEPVSVVVDAVGADFHGAACVGGQGVARIFTEPPVSAWAVSSVLGGVERAFGGVGVLSAVSSVLSAVSSVLSAVSSVLSAVSSVLSAVSSVLSAV